MRDKLARTATWSYFCIVCFRSFAIISAHPRHHGSEAAEENNSDNGKVNRHASSSPSYMTGRRKRHDGGKRSFFILEQPDQRGFMNPALSFVNYLSPLSWTIRSDIIRKKRKHASNNHHKTQHSKNATHRNDTSKHRHRKHHDIPAIQSNVQRNTPKARSLKDIYGHLYGFHKARRPLDSLASGIIG